MSVAEHTHPARGDLRRPAETGPTGPAGPTGFAGSARAGWHNEPSGRDVSSAAKAAARRVLGQRFGIVRDCTLVPDVEGWPGLHVAVARGALRIPGWRFPALANGTGVSLDVSVARTAAVAEAVERYCAMAPADPTLLVRAAYADLGDLRDLAVPPRTWALLSSQQYRRVPILDPLDDEKVIDWCWAHSLTRGGMRLVPSALVFCDPGGRPPNNFLPELPSSGFACHASIGAAVRAGLFEVLERDALTIAWQNRLPMTPLNPRGTAVEDLLKGPLAQSDLDFQLFAVPTDGPCPVVLAVAWGDEMPPHAAVGAACRASEVEAAQKALFEAGQMVLRMRRLQPPRPQRVREFADHAALYGTREGARLLRRHLVAGSAPRSLATGPRASANLGEIVAELARVGLDVLAVEVTTVDVATAGFRVVRVVVPGTLDMTSDARFPRLGGDRLYQLPVRLGLRDTPISEGAINRLPVPLA